MLCRFKDKTDLMIATLSITVSPFFASRAFSDSALGANGEMTHRWDQRLGKLQCRSVIAAGFLGHIHAHKYLVVAVASTKWMTPCKRVSHKLIISKQNSSCSNYTTTSVNTIFIIAVATK